jgi:thymidine phosphorylase
MVDAQGGDLDRLPPMPSGECLEATRGGYIRAIDTEALGLAIIELGGGRKVMTDQIDHRVGLEMLVRLGEPVVAGQPTVRVFGTREQAEQVRHAIGGAIAIADEPPIVGPLIVERITKP